MLTLKHLRLIEALKNSGSITRAATRLYLTQSALSHQLVALETHFGVTLFERSRPLRLTPAGELLLALSLEVMPKMEAAERNLARLAEDNQPGKLRIVVECHTCYDWLMPAMDAYRTHWPEVEMDLVGGFHTDPVALLTEDKADLVILSEIGKQKGVVFNPLFRYEMLALMATGHPLAAKSYLTAKDFIHDTLITYPAPDRLLDLVRRVLKPAGITPERRHAELTIAIVQLVASRKGLAALPAWAIQSYLERGYVVARPITKRGLWSGLYTASRENDAGRAFQKDFVATLREQAFMTLPGIEPLV
ncbi:LysR family transcriptional regulator [Sulfurirhabdus autotrophica]|uniref:HTH-type transcriptional regulator MetR n=1 Tax=Sulfurirhabdus autotrophica TaxID=1706046 RepID=A0A4R3Y761_9PROT|nr:LysR family transcriptional regulator [Sulfurirhabdus autotrophica]TCV87462.1 transcriptional regulator [Sulfurirhabdus autotrophica]